MLTERLTAAGHLVIFTAMDRLITAREQHLCVACMQPLDGETAIRGCHVRCHRATLRAIERGDTTEAERVNEGKLLPAKKGGRKRSNPVSLDVYF